MLDGNHEIGLGEIGWDGMDWIDLAQDRYQWCSRKLRFGFHKILEKYLSS
jgi:hypothetical protein